MFFNGIIIIVTTDVLGPERELGNHDTRATAVGFIV